MQNNETPKSGTADAASRGRQLIDLSVPDAVVTIDAFGVKTPLNPKSGGHMIASVRTNADEMARRAATYAEDGC